MQPVVTNGSRRQRTIDTRNLSIGSIVLGGMELVDVLGGGPTGTVYKAVSDSDQEVIVKVVDRRLVPTAAERQRFCQTLEQLRRVRHPHFAQYLEFEANSDHCLYAMEYLHGLSLRKLIQFRQERGQIFRPVEVATFLLPVCRALEETRIIHGNLKPSNIMVDRRGAKLVDVGMAGVCDRGVFLEAQSEAGDDFRYLAPEIRRGAPFSSRADIYSLGLVIAEMLTGEVLGDGELPSMSDLPKGADREFEHFFEQALALPEKLRFPTIDMFVRSMVELMGDPAPVEQSDTDDLKPSERVKANTNPVSLGSSDESHSRKQSPHISTLLRKKARNGQLKADGGKVLNADMQASVGGVVVAPRLSTTKSKPRSRPITSRSAKVVALTDAVGEEELTQMSAELTSSAGADPRPSILVLALFGVLAGCIAAIVYAQLYVSKKALYAENAEGSYRQGAPLVTNKTHRHPPTPKRILDDRPETAREKDENTFWSDVGRVKALPQTVRPKRRASVAGSFEHCPDGMVFITRHRDAVAPFCIDRYEAPGKKGRIPFRHISLQKAREQCSLRGARLCLMSEWMTACGALFPYGRTFDASLCNTNSGGPVASGGKRQCRSRWNVFDLSGNVSEWVAEGVAMGGSYQDTLGHASCTAKTAGSVNTGYRCCSEAQKRDNQ